MRKKKSVMIGPISFRLYYSLRLFDLSRKFFSPLLFLLLLAGLFLPSLNAAISLSWNLFAVSPAIALQVLLHHLTFIALNLSLRVSCGKKPFKTNRVPSKRFGVVLFV